MLEGEYLELTNQLKEEFDKKDKELEKVKEKHIDLLKHFLSVYGFIRIIDTADPSDKDLLIEVLREFLSNIFDNIIMYDINNGNT